MDRQCIACNKPVTQKHYGLPVCEACTQEFESILGQDHTPKQRTVQENLKQLLSEFLAAVDDLNRRVGGPTEEFQKARQRCDELAEKLRKLQAKPD